MHDHHHHYHCLWQLRAFSLLTLAMCIAIDVLGGGLCIVYVPV